MAQETFWVGVDRPWRVRAVKDEVGQSVGLSLVLDVEARRGVARRRGRKVEVEVGAEEEEARRKARQGKVRKAGGQDQTRGPGSARQGKARRG